MFINNFRLKERILSVICFSIILLNGCFSTPVFKEQVKEHDKFEKQENIKHDNISAEIDKPLTGENQTINQTPVSQGSGYLSEGTTLSMGVMDGDEELKVLQKIKRLETRLEAEKDKVKTLSSEISALQATKEEIQKDFTDTKKELEEKNSDLLDTIKSLELKLKESDSRAITAEQELSSVKKELLKAQIIETKAQQELYKLKIENLEQDNE